MAMASSKLDTYRGKRNFDRTPEPSGAGVADGGNRFVVHKHSATADHYDLRLQVGDVLKSWAVPKGPSLNPADKRFAVETEDHPLDYIDFEGVIPEGEYGGGPMIVWDTGVWAPMEDVDPAKAIDAGEIRFVLAGEKLKGSWTLVRTGDRKWLLMKRKDEYASTVDIEATQPRSVRTKRLLAEIARDEGGDPKKAATGDPKRPARAR